MQLPQLRAQIRTQCIRAKLPRIVSRAAVFVLLGSAGVLAAQNTTVSPPSHPSATLILPEANRLPDANERMKLNLAHQRQENFDAFNALRAQQISDETRKLLILANDLKIQMDKLGDHPLTPRLLREAEVIELLAHDVQAKMALTVKGG